MAQRTQQSNAGMTHEELLHHPTVQHLAGKRGFDDTESYLACEAGQADLLHAIDNGMRGIDYTEHDVLPLLMEWAAERAPAVFFWEKGSQYGLTLFSDRSLLVTSNAEDEVWRDAFDFLLEQEDELCACVQALYNYLYP